jgi:hypothetical protein
MNIEVTSENAYARKVNVTIAADRVRKELDSAFRDVGRRARLPGFRAGKVPRRVLEARFGANVRNDVASTLIQEAYEKARNDHSLEPVSQPAVVEQGDIKSGAEFAFTIAMRSVRPSRPRTTRVSTCTGRRPRSPTKKSRWPSSVSARDSVVWLPSTTVLSRRATACRSS